MGLSLELIFWIHLVVLDVSVDLSFAYGQSPIFLFFQLDSVSVDHVTRTSQQNDNSDGRRKLGVCYIESENGAPLQTLMDTDFIGLYKAIDRLVDNVAHEKFDLLRVVHDVSYEITHELWRSGDDACNKSGGLSQLFTENYWHDSKYMFFKL